MEFNSSERSTLGVEVEYWVVDNETGFPEPCSVEILGAMGEPFGGEHPKAKHELFESSIEVITGICETPAEARADLQGTIDELQPLLDARGVSMMSSGTHPFARWTDLTISPNPRYHQLVETIQWPARRLMIHGVHVHVGVRSAEKAITTVNGLTTYLPHLLALSCSSPFWESEDTGLASARTKVFEVMPTAGLPPRLDDWAEFELFLDALIRAGSISTVREVWWDIRPHPGFGTVELRMCDGIPSLMEVSAIAALAQCLVTWFDDLIDAGAEVPLRHTWVVRENKWRAARYGLDAQIITDDHGDHRPLKEDMLELVEQLRPIADRLGCRAELDLIPTMVAQGGSYRRQLDLVARGADLRDVVASLTRELTDGPQV
ncbi:MAG: glutamate---cysteine ligase / carboxylate-amine ligase [Actinomycetota bacterium]|nr:glutamate---cysteine ligase / carboxylate-amine ligase [Actinomycetota bacterium]